MQVEFANVVEEIKQLTSEEKEELLFLIQRYLAEERRNEIYDHYRTSVSRSKSFKKVLESFIFFPVSLM